MVSPSWVLVNMVFISKLPIIQLASKLATSSSNKNESWAVNSLTIKVHTIETKSFARLFIDIPIADKMGLKESQLSMIGLRILALM